jgi:hypothetical protein
MEPCPRAVFSLTQSRGGNSSAALCPSSRSSSSNSESEGCSLFGTGKARQRLSEGRGKKGTQKIADLNDKEQGKARDKAAEMLGANPHYVTDAKKIEQDAPESLEQVKQGTLSILQAKKDDPLAATHHRVHSRPQADVLVLTS